MEYIPKLRTLYFYVTDKCNLNCNHCWIDGDYKKNNIFNIELLKIILPVMKKMGLRSVCLTGGEPTLHPQILEIIKLFYDTSISITLLTNGLLLTKDFCKTISNLNLFCSVSLDGALSETHDGIRGKKGAYNITISGIQYLLEYEIPFEVIFAVQKRNEHEIYDFINFIEKIGVKNVKFNFLNYNGGNRIKELKKNEEKIDIKKILDIKKDLIDVAIKEKKINIKTNLPFSFSNPIEIKNTSKNVCGIKHAMGLLPDGNISICGIAELRNELIIGKASPDNIEELWKTHTIFKLIRKNIPSKLEGICAICNIKELCCGVCVAHNYMETGSFFSTYLLCQELYEEKLFPQKYLIPKG